MKLLLVVVAFAALAMAQQNFNFFLDSPARGSITVTPASALVAVGDTVTWTWGTGGAPHAIAAEDPRGPRCVSDPFRPTWFQSSPYYRGNSSAPGTRWTYTIKVGSVGNFPFYCPANPPLSTSFHCLGRDQRGTFVSHYSGINRVWQVTVDPVVGTFTPAALSITQGDVVTWTWRQSSPTQVANIISEGTSFCVPYNASIPANSTMKWAFPEAPIMFNNGLWTPTWHVKFDSPGSFAYFSGQSGDFSRCRSGFRGTVLVNACIPNVNCQPSSTPKPTPVPLGQDPVDPNRRVSGIDNWLLWTTVAYLCVFGVLILATIAACFIGSKRGGGPMIAVSLLPSEQPAWANVQI